MKNRPVGAEIFHAGGRTDMTKLIVAFRSFAKAPKNPYFERPEVALPYSHWPVMGFCSAIVETSQRPHTTYILASPYLRHWSGRFTSYFPNKTLYNLLPRTTLDQILNLTNLYHTVIPYFSKTHFNITLPPMPGYSSLSSPHVLWSKCSRQSQTFYMCATCSVNLIFFDLFTVVIPEEEAKLWSSAIRQYL
jgi:hypothetical protein